ncbi:unnamed protein product [Symbiodinium sp. CCMP2456]|nr:unnamed protein product [Symbiodinium sp. CCMP2456]
MASSDPITIAADLTAALGAARRMGWAPVVGELTADAIADLNDAAQAANLLLEGTAAGTRGVGTLENIPEVGEESDDDVVLGAPLVAAGSAGGAASAVASPKAAAPTPIAPTPPTPSAAGTRVAPPVKATPPELLAPPPMPTPTAASRASSPVGADFFIGAATKAKANLLLAARADPWEVAMLTSMPASGTATQPVRCGGHPRTQRPSSRRSRYRRPPLAPKRRRQSRGSPSYHGLGGDAESALASGATMPTAQPKHKGPPATTIPPTALTVDPNMRWPHSPPTSALRRLSQCQRRRHRSRGAGTAQRGGGDRATPGQAAAARRGSSQDQGRGAVYQLSPDWPTPGECKPAARMILDAGAAMPWTAEEAGEAAEISPEYFEYKRHMERELREIEDNGAVPRPPTPCRGEDRPETDYPFLRRLPPGMVGARITLRHSREAVWGGEGRCLRPASAAGGGAEAPHGWAFFDAGFGRRRRLPDGHARRGFCSIRVLFCMFRGARCKPTLAPRYELRPGAKKSDFTCVSGVLRCFLLPRHPTLTRSPFWPEVRRQPGAVSPSYPGSMAAAPASEPQPGTFAAFLAEVSAAGGGACMTTFAALGVTSRSAVGPAGPALLKAGVPQQIIVALGAGTIPPEQRGAGAEKGRPTLNPKNTQQAIDALEGAVLASTTRRSVDSGKIQILAALAACLKDGGYKSAQLYIDAALYHHEHVLQREVLASKTFGQSGDQGHSRRQAQAFDLGVIAVLVRFGPADGPLDLTLSSATFGGGITLDIPLHKTAQGGEAELTRRSLRCVCTAAVHPLCPACAARRHLARLHADGQKEPTAALFPTSTTEARTKAASLCWGLRRGNTHDHARRRPGAHLRRTRGQGVRGHVLGGPRRGRRHHPTPAAVERYTQAAPLTCAAAAIPAQALAPAAAADGGTGR